jgi:hypothetical protein
MKIKFYLDAMGMAYLFQLRHEWAWYPELFKCDFIGKLFLKLNKVDYTKWR